MNYLKSMGLVKMEKENLYYYERKELQKEVEELKLENLRLATLLSIEKKKKSLVLPSNVEVEVTDNTDHYIYKEIKNQDYEYCHVKYPLSEINKIKEAIVKTSNFKSGNSSTDTITVCLALNKEYKWVNLSRETVRSSFNEKLYRKVQRAIKLLAHEKVKYINYKGGKITLLENGN
jgi:hypothetical protein